jgi:small subunit ribosomal protein S9
MAEERDDLPQEPESGAPEDEARESDAVGPEIEGIEELTAQQGGGDAPAEEPAAEEAAAEAEEPAAAEGEPAPTEAAAEGQPAPDAPAEEPAAEDTPPRERRSRRDRGQDEPEEEVIPGMHLEPDLVLEEAPAREENEFGQYAEAEDYEAPEVTEEEPAEAPAEPEPVAHTPLDLAADARYRATGKRKRAVARVILKPGEGTYSINGRHLDEYFPRVRLQRLARQPLEAAGYHSRMDVVARIHGGGVSAQATALRHGVARALVEADPALRGELKRRGYLTRDPRVKERKKAGLKKARKRPQFSKR